MLKKTGAERVPVQGGGGFPPRRNSGVRGADHAGQPQAGVRVRVGGGRDAEQGGQDGVRKGQHRRQDERGALLPQNRYKF